MNYKTSTKTGYYVGNAAAAFMIFFGGLLVVCLMAPEARMAGQFYSGAYGLSFLMALAPIIGGILIIRRNMRRFKKYESRRAGQLFRTETADACHRVLPFLRTEAAGTCGKRADGDHLSPLPEKFSEFYLMRDKKLTDRKHSAGRQLFIYRS